MRVGLFDTTFSIHSNLAAAHHPHGVILRILKSRYLVAGDYCSRQSRGYVLLSVARMPWVPGIYKELKSIPSVKVVSSPCKAGNNHNIRGRFLLSQRNVLEFCT